ncbi:MAG TPA: hypothetical protein VLB04_02235 [Methanotrichaceae archaeon]|nr:hypothetical protein [Methanotrichaceae archaeon]
MSFKSLMALAAISIILLIPSAMGDYQVFTLWHHNVSLDFGAKNITVEPQATTSDINSITRGMIFRGDSADDWGAVYLMTKREPVPTVLEDLLRRLMKPTTKAVEVDSGLFAGVSGLIAAGDARVEHGFGQRCYGAAAIISPPGVGESVTLILIGHFKNESLNEQLIRTARVDYAPP